MNKSEKQYKDEIIDKNSIFDELLAQDDKTHLFIVKTSNRGTVIDPGELTVVLIKDAIKKRWLYLYKKNRNLIKTILIKKSL